MHYIAAQPKRIELLNETMIPLLRRGGYATGIAPVNEPSKVGDIITWYFGEENGVGQILHADRLGDRICFVIGQYSF